MDFFRGLILSLNSMEASGKTITLEISEIQPSQLYVSSAKLERIRKNFNYITTNSITPVPIKELEGRIIYTDGHTRALALFLENQTLIRAYWDDDELDLESYRVCVDWCRSAEIYTVGDLKDRIIPPDEYQVKWLNQCREMQKTFTPGK